MTNRFTRKEFLEALFGQYFQKQDGFIIVKTGKHLDRKISTRYFPNVEILAKEQYHADQEVYFGICPRETMKPDKAHVRFVSALWAGLDLGPDGYSGREHFFSGPSRAAKAVRSFPLPPSIIVESGWGMHLYWLLNKMWQINDRERIDGLLRKIAHYFQCGNEVSIDAGLRLPGTYNCKMPGKSVICRIKYMNTDFRYHLEDFEKMRLEPETATRPVAKEEWIEVPPADAEEVVTGARSYEVEEQGEDLSAELQEYMHTESPVENQLLKNAVGHQAPWKPDTPPSEPPAEDTIDSDIAPLLYDPQRTSNEHASHVLSDELADILADRIADRVSARLSQKLMDDLVDRIVEKLALRLISS